MNLILTLCNKEKENMKNLSISLTHTHTRTHLPVLRDSIPHSNFPCVARSHQLVPNKEEVIHRYAQTKNT